MRKEVPLIVELIDSVKESGLGRTALMKCLYLLQAVRNVPLDYHFRLHTYGPYDEDVIDDLSYAENLKAVKSELVFYPTGYGYDLKPGPKSKDIKKLAGEFLKEYHSDINWVVKVFAKRKASDLEMVGTIVYVDRAAKERGNKLSADTFADKVHDIKPHFTKAEIKAEVTSLKKSGFLIGAS